MLTNRSIPKATVIPVLVYPDVNAAATWLCDAFGFTVRLRADNHRLQLNVGDGAITLREFRSTETDIKLGMGFSLTIRISNINDHCEHARRHGASITNEPITYPYGERQYNTQDFAGYCWTFSESVADVHPQEWGGTMVASE